MKILRLGDKYIQHVLKLVSHRDYRFSKETCVVTGTKLVRDLGKRYRFKEIICSRPSHPDLATLNFDELHLTEPRILRKIAELEEFDGLIGTLTLPARRSIKEITHPRLLLCLDYIEDPGLMGTLLRTAVSFQWQAVFFLPNCADPFSSRCIRASQGALFNIPHCKGNMEDLQKLCRRGQLTLSVPHPAGVDVSSDAYEPPKGQALLLREEYTTPWAPPREALKVKVPDPWRGHPKGTPDGEEFDFRALDVAVQGGILMHHIKHTHFAEVSRTPFLASPRA